MDISLHPHTASPAMSTYNKAVAHSQMPTPQSKQVALHLPYLWCEQRSTPEPLQPTRRLFSASSRWRFSPGKERDYGDLFPLLFSLLYFCLSVFLSIFLTLFFLSLFLSLFPSPFRLLPFTQRLRFSPLSFSRMWKHFTDMWDKTGSVE